jgi:hypothetical protein
MNRRFVSPGSPDLNFYSGTGNELLAEGRAFRIKDFEQRLATDGLEFAACP